MLARILVVVGLFSLACAVPRPVVLYGPDRDVTKADYPDVLRSWTRSAKVYQGFENKLFLTATYHTPEFRRVFALAFPDIYGHGGEVTRRELVDLSDDVEQFHTFFLAAYTPDRKWNDFSKKDSIWKITLTGSDNVSVEPTEIISIKIDENIRAVYPYIGRFHKTYLVRFPLTDPLGAMVIMQHTKQFTIRVASALGIAEPVWHIETPNPTP